MRHKLLLADDSAAIQQVIRLAFDGEDVDVVVVDDGANAIAAIERESPDIVLADVNLPGTDGYDLAACIRNDTARASLPVVLLAGAFEPVDRARADAVGCRDILVKPFGPRDLVSRVKTLLDPAYIPPPVETEPAEAAPAAAALSDPEAVEPEPLYVAPERTPVPIQPAAAPIPIDVTPERTREPEPVSVTPVRESIAVASTTETVEVASAPEPTSLAHRPMLAQAFAAFLTAERELAPGSDASLTTITSPAVSVHGDLADAVKRELMRRVRRRLTKSFVRDTAEKVVGKTVDRLVREELARMNVRPPTAE